MGRRFAFTASLSGAALLLLLGAAAADNSPGDNASVLAAMRVRGDLAAQRRHVWSLFGAITQAAGGKPSFEKWHGEDEIFSNRADARGIEGFSRTGDRLTGNMADVPVLTYTLYNDAAFEHIKRYRLASKAALDGLQKSGAVDAGGDRAVPAFPAKAMVLKTVWWPIAGKGLTALPVWDEEKNPALKSGNAYTTWTRAVAVDPSGLVDARAKAKIEFIGKSFPQAERIGLSAFYTVTVDAKMARRMMADSQTRKAVMIALGRELEAGDHLALVGANLAAREVPDWIWAAFWWHDAAAGGEYAAQRPDGLGGVWRNYRMQTAFDAKKPQGKDGPHIAFNPWLEGRFPDGGHGGGMASNCMACHQRASYPPLAFLPVTRGDPDLKNDPAQQPGRLRTSFLWGLAIHAR